MALAAGVGVGVPAVLLLLGALLVVSLKARRRSRRRRAANPTVKVAGAWHELADRWHEAGLDRPETASARELAASWLLRQPHDERDPRALDDLVTRVDRAVYHPDGPSLAEAAEVWTLADTLQSRARTQHSFLRRCRHRVDPRPLTHRDSWRSR